LDSPLFAAYLPYQATGAYDFGATDSSRYSGDIAYTDVDNSNGWWEFPSTSYKVGSKSFTSSGYTAIAGQFLSTDFPNPVTNTHQTPEPP
jgi:aspergillopepsin I